MLDSIVLPKQTLIRANTPDKITKVLVIGSGAIKDGWKPLPGALGCPHITDPNVLASILAAYTYHYRRLRNELLITMHDKNCDPVAEVEKLRLELHALREHRQQVATAYQTAQLTNAISLRECAPIEDLLTKPDELGVITTNWDSIVWSDGRFKNVIQLHGISSNPDSLIFPSELGTDDHIFELAVNLAIEGKSEKLKTALAKISGHFRGKDAALLQESHRQAINWLQIAKEVVVWGLALHPYDAELLTVIQSAQAPGRTKHIEQVVIINPEKSDRNRSGILLGAPPVSRRDYNPEIEKWL
jgi:hypothetical protein